MQELELFSIPLGQLVIPFIIFIMSFIYYYILVFEGKATGRQRIIFVFVAFVFIFASIFIPAPIAFTPLPMKM